MGRALLHIGRLFPCVPGVGARGRPATACRKRVVRGIAMRETRLVRCCCQGRTDGHPRANRDSTRIFDLRATKAAGWQHPTNAQAFGPRANRPENRRCRRSTLHARQSKARRYPTHTTINKRSSSTTGSSTYRHVHGCGKRARAGRQASGTHCVPPSYLSLRAASRAPAPIVMG